MAKMRPVYNEEDRKLLIDQTRKAAKFYKGHLEDRDASVIALDTEETLIVVAVGTTRVRLIALLAESGLATVEADPGT